jgi:hypothetical protein
MQKRVLNIPVLVLYRYIDSNDGRIILAAWLGIKLAFGNSTLYDISTEKLNEFACVLGTSAAYLLGDTDISHDQWHSIDEKPISLTYEEENLIKLLRGLPQGDCAKVFELAESLSHDIAEEASHDGQ